MTTTSKSFAIHKRRSRFHQTEKYVCRLQNCMPLKFTEMVKSHLSSILEIQHAQLEAMLTSPCQPPPRRKTTVSFSWKKTQTQSLSGTHLTSDSLGPVLQLINYLSKDEIISTEGLFRKTGNICRQKHLKVKIETATITEADMDALSPHDCANVLKNYILKLAEPLLTQKLFDVYHKIAIIAKPTKEETKSAKLHAIQLALQLLPADNINLLKPLMTLLNRVAFVSNNLMSAYSLGILFAPHILCGRHFPADKLHDVFPKVSDLVTLMIENSSQMFNMPKDLSMSAANFWREMELPNQLYYNSVQDKTDSVATPIANYTPQKVHVVDLSETPAVVSDIHPAHKTATTSSKPSRKRLSSDTSDGDDIPEKRPTPEMFLSPDCKLFDIKPKLSKQTNSIIFHTRPLSSSEKPVARVKPIQQSPISQFFKNVPLKLQRVMLTPRSRTPMALFQSPACSLQF